MANEEHLAILKQGVDVWNRWRQDNPDIHLPDLRQADLHGVDLRHADLTGVDLREADLIGANLASANLAWANLGLAKLGFANLSVAKLYHAILSGTNMFQANLKGASLNAAILIKTDLVQADISEADFGEAEMISSRFGDLDFSQTKGLESVKHLAPSTIGIDAIYKSKGRIPEAFLRGCGVPDDFIDYMNSFICGKPIQFYSCFISYSSQDQEFAERLHADMQSKGLRVWFAPEDLKIGDRFRQRIEESIRVYDKLLVLLSENSVNSSWVATEVEAAFEKERSDTKRMVLFPIRLDDAVMNTGEAWAADIRRTRHIGDFTRWKDHDAYKKAFERLLRDLKAETVGES